MKIIQISDLHIDGNTTIEEEKNIIDKLFEEVKDNVNSTEKLLFIICGDIINKGQLEFYPKSKELIMYLVNKSKDYDTKILFVPGNHDLILEDGLNYSKKIEGFNSFIKELGQQESYEKEKSITSVNDDEIRFILINSMHHANKDYGSINYTELEAEIKKDSSKKIILVAHHTLTSRYEDDHSAITNIYKLNKILNSSDNIIAYIHGHTHGYSDMIIGKKCKIIGVGPWHQREGVHRQFNIIHVKAGDIDNVLNFAYRNDREVFDKSLVYERLNFNIYSGNNLESTYLTVVQSTKEYNSIYNMNINYKNEFEIFEKEVKKIFGDKIETARKWQELEVPEDLYYNHGSYMKVGETSGIDFVVDELTKKATSSRAIIPLIDLKTVIESGDSFLPSFDFLQFGFNSELKEELHISLYLRALEVKHFLKINICELYLMAKNIKDKIRSVKKINMNILAFKAQHKEEYGCFKKSELDMITEARLTKILINKNYLKIAELLEEKLKLSETVVEYDGIIALCNAVEEENNESGNFYQELFDRTKELKELYKVLKIQRESTSEYMEIEKNENFIKEKISNIIKVLKKMEEEK